MLSLCLPQPSDILAEREGGTKPALTWKCPAQGGFRSRGDVAEPRESQETALCPALCPVGHRQALAAMPAGFGTSPGTRAKAGAPWGMFHPAACQPSMAPPEPSPSLAQPLPPLAGHLQHSLAPSEGFWDDLTAEHWINIPVPCSSSGGTEMREQTAQSSKDLCVCSSAACAM